MIHDSGDILERVSAASLGKDSGNTTSIEVARYAEVKSPAVDKPKDGALRAGPPPVIWSKSYQAFLLQYAGDGLLYSVMYNLIYTFFNNYLRMSGYATASTYVIFAMPYTFKAFMGVFIDCYPIRGYRRRPYMLIGWAFSTVCFAIMTFLPVGDPYYPEYDWVYLTEDMLTPEQRSRINYDAPGSGAKWIVLMMIANIGHAVSFTATGGMVVEIAQREPENVRGTLQTLIWVARDVGGALAGVLVGFGLNSADFGGGFTSSIGVNAVMGICTVVSLVTCAACLWIEEERSERRELRVEIGKLFDLIQMRVVYQVLAFQFLMNMCSYVSVTAASPIASVWASVEPLASNIISILSYIVSMCSLLIVSKYGLNWSWRSMIVWCQVAVVVIDVVPTFLTIWDVIRNQWFWLGLPLLDNIPSNFSFIVSTFCMVEIMEEGNEASFYGLVVSVSSLASPFAVVITKNIDAHFDIATSDLQIDDNHVRWHVTYAYMIAYAFKLFAAVWVVLLPRQKAECQELRRTGGKNKTIGVMIVIIVAFLYVWCILTNIMAIFPSTACYTIAGGSGC